MLNLKNPQAKELYQNEFFTRHDIDYEILKSEDVKKTLDGYISVSKIKDVHVSGLSKYQPRIVVEGFYVRGIDCDKPARYLYGYYDNCAGFLLSELSPITSDLFCEKVKTVCSDIIKNLTYKPTYLYREDGDKFDNFIKDARKCGIDIEYYPELHVSVK